MLSRTEIAKEINWHRQKVCESIAMDFVEKNDRSFEFLREILINLGFSYNNEITFIEKAKEISLKYENIFEFNKPKWSNEFENMRNASLQTF